MLNVTTTAVPRGSRYLMVIRNQVPKAMINVVSKPEFVQTRLFAVSGVYHSHLVHSSFWTPSC